MTKVDEISNVGILVKNQKRSIDFYTKKLGLKKLTSMPEFGYVELRAKKNGKDAVLNLWEPAAWGMSAKDAKKKIGQITGVAFSTPNLDATVAQLKKKGVKVDVWNEGDDYRMATVYDPDGNGLFLTGPKRPRTKRAGIDSLEFVTISSRNSKKTGAFFEKALGLKKDGDEWAYYRATAKGTALMPFTPKKSNYKDPADYKADMAAIGEETGIMMTTSDVYKLEKSLIKKGVKIADPAKPRDWGQISADVLDPDQNLYTVFEPSRE